MICRKLRSLKTWHELSWECQDYIRTSSWNIIGENLIWQKPMKFNWGKNWNMTWANDQTVCNWNAKHDFFFLWFALTRHQTSERERELAICSCTNAYWSRDVLLYVQNYFPSNVVCCCEAALKKPLCQKLIFCKQNWVLKNLNFKSYFGNKIESWSKPVGHSSLSCAMGLVPASSITS